MRQIVAEGRGVLLYAAGHEGRGVGLVAKLQAYMLQDQGHDTVDAQRRLGLPVDARDFREAVQVLRAAGVRSSRLLTNNPAKASAMRSEGVPVERLVSLPTAPHLRNRGYVQTKQQRLGHRAPGGEPLPLTASAAATARRSTPPPCWARSAPAPAARTWCSSTPRAWTAGSPPAAGTPSGSAAPRSAGSPTPCGRPVTPCSSGRARSWPTTRC
jgi:hypothetical protein